MKTIYLVIITAVCLIGYPAVAQTAPSGTITYQQFYDQLSPYGTWIHYPGYGEVWHPNVGEDFKPYATNGYWENTDQGPYWESGYNWGWAPFHYGRWTYDDSYGWLWIPGYEWSPAWVTWGDVDDYYAWAPLAPELIADASVRPHDYYWNMVPRHTIYDHNLSHYLANESHIRQNASRIQVRSGKATHTGGISRYQNAPESTEIARHLHQTVPTRTIREVSQPLPAANRQAAGNRAAHEIPVYKPDVQVNRSVELRHADPQRINPIRETHQWPSNDFKTHQYNIEQLPRHESGMERGRPAMHEMGSSGGSHGRR